MGFETYKGYDDPKELRRIQILSTMLMDELDRVCGELGISYQAYGGTEIGAIRHKGFIPWDDDVDISMFREDYEKFLAEGPSHIRPDFIIQNGRTDDFFPAVNSNLSLRGTVCVPDEFMDCPFTYAISIGIFPFDKIPRDPKTYARTKRRTWFWGRLNFLRATPRPHIPLGGWKRTLALAGCFLIHWTMRILHVPSKFILSHWDRAARLGEHEETDVYASFVEPDPENWTMSKSDVFPTVRVPFEDIMTVLPKEYDKLLRLGYGDYMQLPPEDDRKNHHPGRLDFGKWKDVDVTKGSRDAFAAFGEKSV